MHLTETLAAATTQPVTTGMLFLLLVFIFIALVFDFLNGFHDAITGAILGVGTTRGWRYVRWIWGQRIITAWILTIPCSAFMAAVAYLLMKWLVQPFFT